MALKALMLKRQIDLKQKVLADLLKTETELEERESNLAKAIEEATTEEETKAVEAEIDIFNSDKDKFEADKAEVEKEIEALKADLAEEEKEQETEPVAGPEEKPVEQAERKVHIEMNKRNFFANMDEQTRSAIFAQDDVKEWLGEYRSAMKQKRAITNVGLTIPTVMLGVLRQNIEGYSKLLKHVNLRRVDGEGRMLVVGNVPEAIWTECCANLNELSLTFNDVSVSCWKISGFYAVCVANYEDSDIDLANEILSALGQAIGLGVDKAILFGGNSYTVGEGNDAVTVTNTNMPLGIVTRLAQTSQPSGYSATERAWEDLHTSNIQTISAANTTGIKLFQNIVTILGNVSAKYAREGLTWVMNQKTFTKLQVEAMSINAAGAIVSGMGNTMPIVGGALEILDFMPDNVMVVGYFEDYLMAERAGAKFAESQHVRFLNDQIVFKGTARYDGKPVIAEAFAAIGIAGTTVSAGAVTFAQDTANA